MTAIQTKRFNYNDLPDNATKAFVSFRETLVLGEMKRTAENIWKIGQALTEVKEKLPYGDYTLWVETNLRLNIRTAFNFCRVFETFTSEKISELGVAPSVLYALAAPSVDDETRAVAVELVESGDVRTVADAHALIEAAKPITSEKISEVTTGFYAHDDDIPEPTSDDAPPPGDDEDDYAPPPAEPITVPVMAPSVTPAPATTAPPTAVVPSPTPKPKKGNEIAAGAEVFHDTLKDKVDASTLSDEDWLETLPIWRVLHQKAHRGVILRGDLLAMRKLWEHKEAFSRQAHRAYRFDAVDNTPAVIPVVTLSNLPHPMDWQIHPQCFGNGCPRCCQSGYDVSLGGISPLRVESGEVGLQ